MVEASWSVTPSGPLRGDVHVRGSKNAVTKHMVAALLGEGPSVIRQVPEVGDVTITADILRSLGVGVDHDVAAGVTYLLSEQASYVTGITLDINGGMYM